MLAILVLRNAIRRCVTSRMFALVCECKQIMAYMAGCSLYHSQQQNTPLCLHIYTAKKLQNYGR